MLWWITLREGSPPVVVAHPHWWSADTAPEAFAVTRPLWVAPSFLLLFAGLSAAIVPLLSSMTEWYAEALAVVTGKQRWELLAQGGSLSFRPFLALLILLLSLFAVGSWALRVKLLLFAWTLYAATILLVDATLVRYHDQWTPWPFAPVGGIVAGLTGLLVIIVTVFARYLLPTGIRVLPLRRRSRLFVWVFLASVGLAIAITVGFSWAREEYFDGLHVRFIGGLDSNLVIFLIALVILLFAASATVAHGRPTQGPRLSVAFLIPAHNEARDLRSAFRRSTSRRPATRAAARSTWSTTTRRTTPWRWRERRWPVVTPSKGTCSSVQLPGRRTHSTSDSRASARTS